MAELLDDDGFGEPHEVATMDLRWAKTLNGEPVLQQRFRLVAFLGRYSRECGDVWKVVPTVSVRDVR